MPRGGRLAPVQRVCGGWLATVQASWGTFGDAGPIRVGVKTCADRVFIRTDWQALPRAERPELLRPLVTHRDARRFRGRRARSSTPIAWRATGARPWI